MKPSFLDRLLLMLTVLLASWQVAIGLDGFSTLPLVSYTICFGIILIAVLLIVILGFEVLESPAVVILSTITPLSLSLGIVWQHFPSLHLPYLFFVLLGFLAIVFTRVITLKSLLPLIVLTIVHGLAGLTILLFPLILVLTGKTVPAFALVSLGGALIGIGGILLAFMKAGRPLVSHLVFFKIFPALLFLMTVTFVLGFSAR